MASPSRSLSLARRTVFAFAANFFKSVRILPFPRTVIYSGLKLLSISIPILDLGKSIMCPIEAVTLYSEPKYLFIVLAFAGDSTITSVYFFGVVSCF